MKWQKRIEHRKEARKLEKKRRKERRKKQISDGIITDNSKHRKCTKIVNSKCNIRVAIDLAFEEVYF